MEKRRRVEVEKNNGEGKKRPLAVSDWLLAISGKRSMNSSSFGGQDGE